MFKKRKKNLLKSIKNKVIKLYRSKIKKNKVKFNMLETIIFMLIVFAFGLIIGGIIMYGKGSLYKSSNSLNEFIMSYNEIKNSYYKEVNEEELLESGIKGMIRYLGDPYSTYMDKDTAVDFNDDVEGTYQGIGAEIRFNDDKKIVFGNIFSDSPAEKAGIKENDILLEVEKKDISNMQLSEIADIVKGKKGTKVTIKILRDKEEKEITITRGVVDNISVTSEVIEKNNKKIGYLYISVFASNTAKQFKNKLLDLEKGNIDSLIIDVRGNSGGYLTTVSEIVSLFIKKGEPIYRLKTKDKTEIKYDETIDERKYPIVVLADGGSASASELLVSALQEVYKAKIVGTKTFGKGKVQKVTTLSSGAVFKYTHQEWLTPNGNYIDGVGIEPDIEEKYIYNEEGKDNQKEKAIEIISK